MQLLLSRSLLLASFSAVTLAAQVQLGNTTLTGTSTLQVLEFFGGIPYAEPPLGNLRFQPPVLKPALDVPTFNATNFGPQCLQLPANVTSSEDCLTVNVHRPINLIRGNRLLPVMVFIHGGGFLAGNSSQLDGNPLVLRSIARGTPVIYASLNYRLGPLGFPQGTEAEQKGALNLGLKDQLTALEWIKRNIAAFGGDPAKVTVFGESAGAVSIGVLYLNSGLENLVRGAILESGGAGTSLTFEASRRQGNWDSFVAAVPECSNSAPGDSFTCLRTASSSILLQATGVSLAEAREQFPFVPALDGPGGVLPELPSEMYTKGQFSKIPFISGNNLDEGTLFAPTTTSSSDTIRNDIISNYTTNSDGSGNAELQAAADQVLQLYPDVPALGSPFNTGNETFGLSSQYKRFAAITGDLLFHSVRRLWTKAAVQAGVKGYGYLFTGPRLAIVPPQLGVSHALELLYVFGLVPLAGGSSLDIALSLKMMDYWISFATILDPNDGKGESRPAWPQYATSNPSILEFNTNNVTAIPDNYRANGIDFINSNPVLFRH
ncbi:extracellular triacylglycerol lipase precursor [Moniliophthora roreri MCA 2997]|uniref:Carboxylic ester hydrolase n=2 Tax=Moniliophthora roreri TaxID=221103 RepID=V2WU90_MONRO|nr:extracellular triacylglycerol lipase precursor [Moniliophthora roreri MCA 2997]